MMPVDPDGEGQLQEKVTGEPILGSRQGALIDAATKRLKNGHGPMWEWDYMVFHSLAQILRLIPENSGKS